MARRAVGIAINGVTGRMGYRQHLVRSLLAIREDGGLRLADGDRLWPVIVLVGRDPEKLRAIADRHGIADWTTDLDAALARPEVEIYYDTQVTSARAPAVLAAAAAGKHIYTEKPTALTLASAVALAESATAAGVRHGVVHDKLFLPGLRKLARVLASGALGRVVSVRIDFGYWVFEGDTTPAQRPSWNYRSADGGGIVTDMVPHWQYLLENLFGPVRAVTAQTATHIPRRWDESGTPYTATAEDAMYAIFTLDGGAVAQVNASWSVRVHRDELFALQVDGTHASAVAGLHRCRWQHRLTTPRLVWDPDLPTTDDYRAQWQEVPGEPGSDNGFRAQTELFLRHVADGAPYRWDLWAGARGVQLAELTLRAAAEGRRIEVPPLGAEPARKPGSTGVAFGGVG